MTRFAGVLALVLLLQACSERARVRVGKLDIEPGYATAAPTADGGTAYFTVRNRGDEPDTVESVAVDGAAVSHLHTMRLAGAMMHMTILDPAVVPAHGDLMLAVGGTHLMFEGMTRALRLGDTVTVRLRFARGGVVSFPLPVRPYGG
jgi:copper(I)-binding protein